MAERIRQVPPNQKRRGAEPINGILSAAALVAAVVAACLLYFHYYQFTTYSVDAEITLSGLSLSETETFKNGNVIIGRDSVSYFADDKVLWSIPVTASNPAFVTRGDYFALFDRGGYQIHIFDENGALGTAKVSREICGADISESGVVAVFTESGESSYISYFDRYGSRISIEIKTALQKSGYPLDIAISPDGQKLAVVYYSTDNGVGESRLVCYDFEFGRSNTSYITASYSDYYEAGTMLVSVHFFSNEAAVAVGTDSLSFLSFQGEGACSRNVIPMKEEVRSIFFYRNSMGIVADGSVRLLDFLGNVKSTFSIDGDYDMILADDRRIVFRDGARLFIYNSTGKLRYDGELPNSPVSLSLSGRNSILVNDGTAVERLTFK